MHFWTTPKKLKFEYQKKKNETRGDMRGSKSKSTIYTENITNNIIRVYFSWWIRKPIFPNRHLNVFLLIDLPKFREKLAKGTRSNHLPTASSYQCIQHQPTIIGTQQTLHESIQPIKTQKINSAQHFKTRLLLPHPQRPTSKTLYGKHHRHPPRPRHRVLITCQYESPSGRRT